MKKTYAMIALCGATLAAVAPTASGQLTEDLKLTASDGAGNDEFGRSVSIFGSIAIVGARLDDDAGTDSGSAYVFDTTTGQQLFKLTASDAAGGDEFGWSVGMSGTTAIAGARLDDDAGMFSSGSAYLFNTTTGQQFLKLTASDAAELDGFGFSVAISTTVAIVGANQDDDAGDASGSVYVFDVATGQQLFKLTASDAAAGDEFGYSVAISGSTAIVGARSDDDNGVDSGSAYVFDTTTGQQLFKLTASDAAAGDEFGYSVAISGTTAIVGARRDADAGPGSVFGSGSAYVFDVATGQQLFKLTASDAAARDQFGFSVAITGTAVIVAAHQDDDAGTNSGSAYVFDLVPPCPGDIADDFGTIGEDGMVSFGDFLALLGLIGTCPGGVPGCTGDFADATGTLGADGVVGFGDFLALLGLVGPCP